MGDTRDKLTGTGENPYIWLRYTTQFTTGGRTHTIEMGIPMPLGASADTREQLIREAEAGMDQLSRHVENRVTQMLQRNAQPQGNVTGPHRLPDGVRQGVPPHVGDVGVPPAGTLSGGQVTRPSTPTPNSSAVGTPQSSSSPAPVRDGMQAPSSLPPTRPNTNVGASMPLSPNMPGEASGNIKLSQFMHYIREAWGLTPKQAMELLNVKTLNGLNYRDALKQLQPLVAGDQGGTSTPPGNVREVKSAPQGGPINRAPTAPASTHPSAGASQGNGTNQTPPLSSSAPTRLNVGPQSNVPSEREATPQRDVKEVKEATPSPAGHTTPQITFHLPDGVSRPQASPLSPGNAKEVKEAPQGGVINRDPTPTSSTGSSKIPIIPISSGMVRDAQNTYRFDEEDDSELELDELAEEDGATEQQQIMARIKLDELKEVRGSSTASPGRLTVLQNVTNSQISETQLQQLIRAAWGATSLKKLKVDQVEALISWAKEDLFVDEVEAVLALIAEEDTYARSDW